MSKPLTAVMGCGVMACAYATAKNFDGLRMTRPRFYLEPLSVKLTHLQQPSSAHSTVYTRTWSSELIVAAQDRHVLPKYEGKEQNIPAF
jgi:hypothetical protein